MNLEALSQSGQAQFALHLTDAPDLQVQEVVRRIPSRRLVAKGEWNGQGVFAKIFLGKDAEKYAKRDADGIAILLQEGIATPTLLFSGAGFSDSGEQVQLIVLEEIKSSKNVEELWSTLKSKARLELAERLMKIIALHHDADIVHTDLHLKNFLVADNLIYTLDGDGVRQYAGLTYKKALHNLAEMISKFDALEQAEWLPQLLETYQAIIKWHQPMTVEGVARLANHYRQKAIYSYADKKVFRSCTDVMVLQGFRYFLAISRDFSIDVAQAQALDSWLTNPSKNIKNGNTCTIGKAELASRTVVIKRYNIKGFWHRIGRAFRKSRASVSWANAHRLQLLNIATPKPLALVEERLGLFRGRAYFLSEYVGAPDALQFFAKCTNDDEKQRVAHNIATLFYRLYLLHISHGDMKATNIKIVDEQPWLIDLDSVQAHGFGWFNMAERNHVRDLKRLMKNWQDDVQTSQMFKDALLRVYDDDWDPWHINVLKRAGIA